MHRSDAQLPGEAAQRPLVGDESNFTLSSIRQRLEEVKGQNGRLEEGLVEKSGAILGGIGRMLS
jgi:hypothetical protein